MRCPTTRAVLALPHPRGNAKDGETPSVTALSANTRLASHGAEAPRADQDQIPMREPLILTMNAVTTRTKTTRTKPLPSFTAVRAPR